MITAMGHSIPLISVVMPVHNARPFLDESIASILDQTLTDFEFVILDDGSTDGSSELLRSWAQKDRRIHLHEGRQRLGLSGSSNFIVSKAAAAVVARMDADDVSHPDRLQREFTVLTKHPDVAAVGTLCDGIDARGRVVRPRDRWRIVRRSEYIPFPHGSVMFRKKVFDAVGGYRNLFVSGEDQDLFLRMTSVGRVVTLPDTLYHYRYHSDNATLLTGAQAVQVVVERHSPNGQDLASYYMLGAMRLWSGQSPQILQSLLARKSWPWNLRTLTALVSATWGSVSPATLRMFLRSFIRARDLLASFRVKDGRPYEWRWE